MVGGACMAFRLVVIDLPKTHRLPGELPFPVQDLR